MFSLPVAELYMHLHTRSVPFLVTELRKQKLMEYLKAKGKFKEPNSK